MLATVVLTNYFYNREDRPTIGVTMTASEAVDLGFDLRVGKIRLSVAVDLQRAKYFCACRCVALAQRCGDGPSQILARQNVIQIQASTV